MQKSLRLLGALALIGLGIWAWWLLFPSPERVIRSRLNKLSRIVSFTAQEGGISKAYNAQKLIDYFTPEVEISIDAPRYPRQNISARQELIQGLLWAQSNLGSLKVEFIDISVSVGADQQTATANLVGKATIGKDADFNVQELNFLLKKVEGKWLIYRIETVRSLSRFQPAATLTLAQS